MSQKEKFCLPLPSAFVSKADAWLHQTNSAIIKRSQKSPAGRYWLNPEIRDQGFALEANGTIMTGTPGIAVHLLESYVYSGVQAYLHAAQEAFQWSFSHFHEGKSIYPSFYIGSLGLAYGLGRLYEVTHEEKYLKEANKVLTGIEVYIRNQDLSSDWLNGHAGNLYVLLYLDRLSGQSIYMPLILSTVEKILRNAIVADNHLKWGYKAKNLDSLCGVSHGAGGIALGLMLAGSYLKTPVLSRVAAKAFAYEDTWFDKAENNWADLRRLHRPADAREAYKAGNHEWFTHTKNVNNWSHGAAGIGLVRLRAWELTGHTAYLDHYRKACTGTLNYENREAEGDSKKTGLSTGRAGRSELFLQGSRLLNDETLLRHCLDISHRLIDRHNTPSTATAAEHNDGFMTGLSGVAYSLLRILNPATPSMLCPSLAVADSGKVNDELNERFERLLIAAQYPRTTRALQDSDLTGLKKSLDTLKRKGTDKEELLTAFRKDELAIKLNSGRHNYLLETTEKEVRRENSLTIIEAGLQRPEAIRLHHYANVALLACGNSEALLVRKEGKVMDIGLDYFPKVILLSAKAGETLQQLIQTLLQLGYDDPEKESLHTQLKILVEADIVYLTHSTG